MKDLRFYPTCPANKLACHSFNGFDRRHETPGTE